MAAKRNSRSMNAEDLIFLMRHDRAKVNRLRSFLSWKDVRKNAKETGGDQVEDMMEDSATGTDSLAVQQCLRVELILLYPYSRQTGQNASQHYQAILGTGKPVFGCVYEIVQRR